MSDRKFTFIELHLDGDHQFGPRTIDDALPFGEKHETTELEDETDDEAAAAAEDEGSSAKGIVGVVVALAVFVALGVAAKKYRGGDDEDDFEAEEQPDVIVN